MKLLRILLLLATVFACVLACSLGSFGNGLLFNVGGKAVQFRSFIPPIVVPGEILPGLGITNTMFTTIIVDLVIIALALIGRAQSANWTQPARKAIGTIWEMTVEGLYNNFIVPSLGARAKTVLPVAVTAFCFILVSGMFELVPGVESVGILEPAKEPGKGYCAAPLSATGPVIITGKLVKEDAAKECEFGALASIEKDAVASITPAGGPEGGKYGAFVLPILRRPTSDLSTTLALALLGFLFIEIQGIRANGVHYFERFFQIGQLKKVAKGGMSGFIGLISFLVGFLELLSEFVRIISFSFRLFGNMFAGTILVLVMGFLVPFVLPGAFLLLEFGVAFIQSFVFMMLVTVFTSMAVAHGEH